MNCLKILILEFFVESREKFVSRCVYYTISIRQDTLKYVLYKHNYKRHLTQQGLHQKS